MGLTAREAMTQRVGWCRVVTQRRATVQLVRERMPSVEKERGRLATTIKTMLMGQDAIQRNLHQEMVLDPTVQAVLPKALAPAALLLAPAVWSFIVVRAGVFVAGLAGRLIRLVAHLASVVAA